jgi:protein-L-isoaspartate(D-aspartate) O-methyltransferase
VVCRAVPAGQLTAGGLGLWFLGVTMKFFSQPDAFADAQARMVREQLADFPPPVVAAMGKIPRHEFLPAATRAFAYADCAVPIGFGQTISQPWIVATMTTQLNPKPADRILEIGTGTGYQAAILAQLVAAVHTIEILEPLARRARETLHRLGCANVQLRQGDGYGGWPEAAPFDGVIVTCAPEAVPEPLSAQLKDGGRLLIPVGPPGDQILFVFQKHQGRLRELAQIPVRFVPMTGRAETIL